MEDPTKESKNIVEYYKEKEVKEATGVFNCTEKHMQKYLEVARTLSNKELFEATFEKSTPDDYDGAFTAEGLAEFLSYKEVLEARLASWMEE